MNSALYIGKTKVPANKIVSMSEGELSALDGLINNLREGDMSIESIDSMIWEYRDLYFSFLDRLSDNDYHGQKAVIDSDLDVLLEFARKNRVRMAKKYLLKGTLHLKRKWSKL